MKADTDPARGFTTISTLLRIPSTPQNLIRRAANGLCGRRRWIETGGHGAGQQEEILARGL
jgi:hypothetical protein